MATYDVIGRTYRSHRRTDPRIAQQVVRALGPSATVVNVGAGTGSYEPDDGRAVVAVEPSAAMRAQRPPGAAPCIAGMAESLPFRDGTFDAAMTVLSVHHWRDQRAGLDELRRVARRQLVLTFEPSMHASFWMVAEYLPEVDSLPASHPIPVLEIAEQLGGAVEVVPVPADCVDGFFTAFWKRPEAYLDPIVRAGISACSQLPTDVVDRAMVRLAADLEDGTWARRHADLDALDEYDGGYRLVVAG